MPRTALSARRHAGVPDRWACARAVLVSIALCTACVVRSVSQPIVGEAARVLKSHPEIRTLTIEGHSSSDERDGWGLAARRATTEQGRSRNRRAELRVTRREQDEAPRSRASGVAQAQDMAKTPGVSSAPQDIAGTVRYDITNPISIPRQSSTLVTIINEYMPGEDILLFRPDPAASASLTYPFRAARIENKTKPRPATRLGVHLRRRHVRG